MPIAPTTFPAFFEALWGYPPFDWQTRLLEQVHAEGWPSTLDLPTGAGKTAALDIALFALALDATRPPEERRQSRRIALVIDRRVVVDQASQRASEMARKLDDAKDGVLADVARALRSLSGDEKGLPVLPAILRGGMPRESEWARSPSQPVILISTVDQVGSRLLFRGYGVSERMRPVHAGLLGRDTLILLDEVHLARPFEDTLAALTKWYAGGYASGKDNEVQMSRSLVFVRMSATVAESTDEPFRLQQTDRENPYLRSRLSAHKHAALLQVKTPRDSVKSGEAIALAAAREAERICKGDAGPRAVAVIVNRVDTARKIASLAREKLKNGWTVSLLTGRMRPLDRLQRQTAVLECISAGRKRSMESPRLLLVSTQAIEAGADFDFDALVTECASLDALRQRFGRLDRLGDLGSTQAVILAGSSSVDENAEPDPIYGSALKATWNWLQTIAETSENQEAPVVDFGIDALAPRLAKLDPKSFTSLLAPRAIAPILTSSHLERWVKTSPAPYADPDVAPFLHGKERGAPEVQIVWRADIQEKMLRDVSLSTLRVMLETVRPSSLEALSIPLWTARQWLSMVAARRRQSEGKADVGRTGALADVEGVAEDVVERMSGTAPVLLWQGSEIELIDDADKLRPGVTLVVPSSYGGLDPHFDGWDPESELPVRDRGDEAQLLQRGRAVLRWHSEAIGAWGSELPKTLQQGPQVGQEDIDEQGSQAERDAFAEWRSELLDQAELPEWTRVALDVLQRGSGIVRVGSKADDGQGQQGQQAKQDNEHGLWRASWQPRRVPPQRLRALFQLPVMGHLAPLATAVAESTTEDDEGSFLGSSVSLPRHLNGVRDFARSFANALHLPQTLVEDLGLAGWIHDLGKADPRFQLLLHGGDPVREATAVELLAKSAVPATDRAARERARQRSGYPSGMRHELLSVAMVESNSDIRKQAHDWDLVLHLVAAHHGWCRPFAPPVSDTADMKVSVTVDNCTLASSTNHDLQRFDSNVPERFWRLTDRYGYWGLAWLEAVLRLADHRESELESQWVGVHG